MRWLRVAAALLCVAGASRAGDLAVSFGADLDTSYVFRGSKRGPLGVVGAVNADYRLGSGLDLIGDIHQYVKVDGGFGMDEGIYKVGLRYRPPWVGSLAWFEGGLSCYTPSGDLSHISFARDDTHGKTTAEWYLRTVFDVPGKPTLDIIHDFGKRTGTYLRASASRSQRVFDNWSLDLNGSVGLEWGQGLGGWRDGHVQSALYYEAVPGLRFGPTLDFWIPNGKVDPGQGVRTVIGFGWQYSPKVGKGAGVRTPNRLGPAF